MDWESFVKAWHFILNTDDLVIYSGEEMEFTPNFAPFINGRNVVPVCKVN